MDLGDDGAEVSGPRLDAVALGRDVLCLQRRLGLIRQRGRVIGLGVHHLDLLGALVDHELRIRRALGVVAGIDAVGNAPAGVRDLDVRGRLTDERQRRGRTLEPRDRTQNDARVHRPHDAKHRRVGNTCRLEGLGYLRGVLVIPDNELHLGAVDSASSVEIFDRQLDRLERASSDRRLVPGKWSFGSDLDLIGLVRRRAAAGTATTRRQPHAGHGDEDENPWLCHASCRPPLPSSKT